MRFPETEHAVSQSLRRLSGLPLQVVFTENTSSMLSYRKTAACLAVRMHRMFLSADEAVLAEIAAFIKNRRAATPLMRIFIRAHGHLIGQARQHRTIVITEGRVHDLAAPFAEINRRYFHESITAAITWSSRPPRSGVQKRNLGSYDRRRDLIRISRYLDRKAVPHYYVAYVVYHEMLHAAVGTQQKNGRTVMHSAEFRRREKLFHDYERAMAWEKGCC